MKKQLYSFCFFTIAYAAAYSQTGLGTISPNSTLDVRGGIAVNLRTFSSSTSLAYTDHTIVFTGTSNSTVTLPDATTCLGRIYWIKNASATLPTPVVTVNTISSQIIDTAASYNLDEPNEIVRLVSDGANWQMTSQDVATPKTGTAGGAWNQGGNTVKSVKSLGTITAFDFPFITANKEAMRITSGGYVGVGSANPLGRIHFVNDNNDAGNDYVFDDYMNGTSITQGVLEKKSSGTFVSPGNLQNGDIIGQFRFVPHYNGSIVHSNGSGIDGVYKGDGTTALSDLRFFSSNVENMRINENGKVSIGTITPDGANPERLLVDAGTTGSYNVISGKGDIDNYLQLNIQNRSNGVNASSDLVASADNGDESVNFIDMGINSSTNNSLTSPILSGINQPYLYSTGGDFVIGNATPSQDLVFFTNAYLATNERIRITASGNVGIGQISGPSEKLVVAGIVSPATDNLYTLGTSTNRWSQVWSVNGVVQTSDAHMKTNISPLNYGLKELLRMRPVSFNWKTDPSGKRKVGLIAQETQKLIPEVVKGDASKENLGMNYAELVTVLIQSLQQQQQKIIKLRTELNTLIQN